MLENYKCTLVFRNLSYF